MTDKQIIIKDYFNIMRDDYGRIYCIQEIGDPKELIKAIREQNEYIQRKEQECEELKQNLKEIKEIAEPFCNACQEFEPEKRGRNCMYCNYNKILQKIKEVEDGR